jgi:hypothetical protein
MLYGKALGPLGSGTEINPAKLDWICVRLQGTAIGAYQEICAGRCNAVDGHEDK